ncbi:hypothetical protein BpHYR1_003044 [Brachionus plicatilis]|uniref:Uncharacterized protein n=1 Tax=Brachionus plicatilis TaxID=10195 RepID=A0A3M7QZQ0_BRAPC|nr:hypothetical protein BpHYR1_003044 [Brachionus plicatilis]
MRLVLIARQFSMKLFLTNINRTFQIYIDLNLKNSFEFNLDLKEALYRHWDLFFLKSTEVGRTKTVKRISNK